MKTRIRALALLGVACALLVTGCLGSASDARYRALQTAARTDPVHAAPPSPESDPLEGAAVLEREAVVRAVLVRNPSLRAANATLRAALARYPQVTALDDPMLGVGAAPRSFGASDLDPGVRVDLSQRLPFYGKRGLRGERALAEAAALSEDLANARVRLAALASARFDDYWFSARALEKNGEHSRLVQALQSVATSRYAAGMAAALDPLAAESELAELEHDRVMLETELRVTSEELNALLRRDPSRPLPPPPGALDLPPDLDIPEDRLVAEALEARPDVRAAAERVRGAEAGVRLARREYWPDVTLVGAHDSLWQEDELQPFVGISLDVPLGLGRRRAAVEEAEAEHERALAEANAVRDEVRASVRGAVARLGEQRHLARIFRDRRLPAARDRLGTARVGFETGQNGFSEVIDAVRALREAELGLSRAIANASRRRAELDRATGHLPGER